MAVIFPAPDTLPATDLAPEGPMLNPKGTVTGAANLAMIGGGEHVVEAGAEGVEPTSGGRLDR